MNGIRIVCAPSQENPFLILHKSPGLASAPIDEGDQNNAFAMAAELYPGLLNVIGKKACEHGLLHRIDNDTEGLLMIAATQEFYGYMKELQKNGGFKKTYTAFCKKIPGNTSALKGFPDNPPEISLKPGATTEIYSYFRPFGKNRSEVRPVSGESGRAAKNKVGRRKLYHTTVRTISEKEACRLECTITEGFRHQVRSHLAWCGLPVIGDRLYNTGMQEKGSRMLFFATGLSFVRPDGKSVSISDDFSFDEYEFL